MDHKGEAEKKKPENSDLEGEKRGEVKLVSIFGVRLALWVHIKRESSYFKRDLKA